MGALPKPSPVLRVVEPASRIGKILPRQVSERCPETLGRALARVALVAEGLTREESPAERARGTYLTNQAAACLAAWHAEEISLTTALDIVEQLAPSPKGPRPRLPTSTR